MHFFGIYDIFYKSREDGVDKRQYRTMEFDMFCSNILMTDSSITNIQKLNYKYDLKYN